MSKTSQVPRYVLFRTLFASLRFVLWLIVEKSNLKTKNAQLSPALLRYRFNVRQAPDRYICMHLCAGGHENVPACLLSLVNGFLNWRYFRRAGDAWIILSWDSIFHSMVSTTKQVSKQHSRLGLDKLMRINSLRIGWRHKGERLAGK